MLDKLDCLLRFDGTVFGKMTFLFVNETSALLSVRKIFGVGLLFPEKAKSLSTSFLGWKWEYGFLEMRLFL